MKMTCNYVATCGDDIKIWDYKSLTVQKQLNFPSTSRNIGNISWSQDGMQLASVLSGEDKVVLTWVKNSAFSKVELPIGQNLTHVRFMKKSCRYLSIGCSNGQLLLWDLKSQKMKRLYSSPSHSIPVTCLEFNWNDTFIASGYENGDVILYNVVTGQASPPLRLQDNQAIRSVRYNAVKKSLLGSASDSGAVGLWDTHSRKLLHKFDSSHFAPATDLAFSPVNDMLLASVGLDKNIICYDVHMRSSVQSLTVEDPLNCVDFLHDGVMLGVGTSRGKVLLYDLRHPNVPYKTLNAHKSSVCDLSFQVISPENQIKSKASSKVKAEVPEEKQCNRESFTSKQRDSIPIETSQEHTNSRNSLTYKIFSPVRNETRESFTGYNETRTSGAMSDLKNGHQLNSNSIMEASQTLKSKNSPPKQQSSDFLPSDARIPVGEPVPLPSSAASPLIDNDSRSSSIHQLFSPMKIDDDENDMIEEVKEIIPSSHMRRQPIGSGWQSPTAAIGVRPVTAGSSENDSQANIPVGGIPSFNLKANGLNKQEDSDWVPNAEDSDSIHVIQADFGQRIDIFSPISSASNTPVARGMQDTPTKSSAKPNEQIASLDTKDVSLTTANLSLNTNSVNLTNRRMLSSPSSQSSSSVKQSDGMQKPDSNDAQKFLNGLDKTDLDGLKLKIDAMQKEIQDARDEMEDFRDMVHRDYLDLHMTMVKEFQIQIAEIQKSLKYYSINEDLLKIIEELQEENKHLRAMY